MTNKFSVKLNRDVSVLANVGIFLVMAALCVVLIYFAYAVPIYPDEINWRVIFTRMSEQAGLYFHYTLSCHPYSGIEVPWFVTPQLYVISIFREMTSFSSFRVPQLLYLFIFYFSVYKYLKLNSSHSSILVAMVVLFLVIITASNVGLVWMLSSRPEIMILVVFGYIIYLVSQKSVSETQIILVSFIWAVSCVAHPKATYIIIPILFVVVTSRCSMKFITCASLLLLMYAYGVSKFAYLFVINCPSEPLLEQRYLSYNANPLDLVFQPQKFYLEFKTNFPGQWSNLLTRAPSQMIFRDGYDINHLPGVKIGSLETVLNSFIFVFYYLVVILPLLVVPFLSCYSIYKKNVAALKIYSIFSVVLVWIIFNRTTNSYDVHLWFQLNAALLALLIFRCTSSSAISIRIAAIFSICFCCLFAWSYYTNIHSVIRSKWSNVDAGPNTSSLFFEPESKLLIKTFQKQICSNNDFLLFDDRTFMSLVDVPQSRPFTYFMVPFIDRGGDAKADATEFLRSIGRVQMIGNCAFSSELPQYFTRTVGRIDSLNICCFSGD